MLMLIQLWYGILSSPQGSFLLPFCYHFYLPLPHALGTTQLISISITFSVQEGYRNWNHKACHLFFFSHLASFSGDSSRMLWISGLSVSVVRCFHIAQYNYSPVEGHLCDFCVLRHSQSCPTLCSLTACQAPLSMALPILCPWHFPGKNTAVGCHFLALLIMTKASLKILVEIFVWI